MTRKLIAIQMVQMNFTIMTLIPLNFTIYGMTLIMKLLKMNY